MGDPAGIGPEIAVKALTDPQVTETSDCFIIGDAEVIADAAKYSGVDCKLYRISNPSEGIYEAGTVNVIDLANADPGKFIKGEVSGLCGRASYEYIEKSAALAITGACDAVATAPINKESLRAGAVPYIGHTEILAGLTGTTDPITMFEVRNMRIFFLTRHVSLRNACGMVTKERIVDFAKRCYAALEKLGVSGGTIAVAGLNPHGGEHGLFGSEEVEHVFPAVELLRGEGYSVEGPVSADSVFHLALQGRYAAVLSLYHDQGHIAAKTLDFERTVSITNGLPFLRTSVDHGTAFDIAGKGIASPVSMTEAIKVAAKYAPYFTRS
mgnify:CR=1 FL=1